VTVKARRKTATAEDLLFAGGASDGSYLAAAAPVVTAARASLATDPPLIPTRATVIVDPGGSPPERDYSLAPPTKSATPRVNRCPGITSSWRGLFLHFIARCNSSVTVT